MTPITSRRILSKITSDARLELWLDDDIIPEPLGDQVVVRIEAAPINPADFLQLVGPADLATLVASGTRQHPRLSAEVKPEKLAAVKARIDIALPVGNEGAGTVVRTGPDARALMGRVVALRDGTYAQYRLASAAECLVFPDGTRPDQAASASINPMTALCMLETMRQQGHSAIVHTAAASNLGQMLVRLCLADHVPLVNIVRSAHQVELLKGLGAEHVIDSTSPTFFDELVAALDATNATLAFDAIGGGRLAGEILKAMEVAQVLRMTTFSRYGSQVLKQVYVYGVLDKSPRVIEGNVGTAWMIGGWLMSWALDTVDPQRRSEMRGRVVNEIATTFSSRYSVQLSMADALRPDTLLAYSRPVTGQKYLIAP